MKTGSQHDRMKTGSQHDQSKKVGDRSYSCGKSNSLWKGCRPHWNSVHAQHHSYSTSEQPASGSACWLKGVLKTPLAGEWPHSCGKMSLPTTESPVDADRPHVFCRAFWVVAYRVQCSLNSWTMVWIMWLGQSLLPVSGFEADAGMFLQDHHTFPP